MAADRAGLDLVGMQDHPYQRRFLDTFVLIGDLLARTERIRIFPDVPVSSKPAEVRMGSGKGNVEYWVAKVTPGKVLFEIEGVPESEAREAFKLAAAKLSVATAFVRRQVR